MNASKPAIWVPGDWNALFGFGTNILLNLLVLTGLLRFVLKMPEDDVVGHLQHKAQQAGEHQQIEQAIDVETGSGGGITSAPER